ncbi:hypothetical protein ACFL3V_02170 [Nanoarchaeota archaeon]
MDFKIFGSRRSQAAMEFLMTYGWAILVVLAAISALAYFGVLSPSKFLPESCTLQPTSGLACLDFRLDTDAATLLIMNSGGRDIVINNMTVGSCSQSMTLDFPDGSSQLFSLSGCSYGTQGAKVKQDVLIAYTDQMSQFSKTAAGTVTARIA